MITKDTWLSYLLYANIYEYVGDEADRIVGFLVMLFSAFFFSWAASFAVRCLNAGSVKACKSQDCTCEKCGKRRGFADKVPILSYLFTGGKCNACKILKDTRIFEAEVTGFVFGLLFYFYRFNTAMLVFMGLWLICSVTDIYCNKIIPAAIIAMFLWGIGVRASEGLMMQSLLITIIVLLVYIFVYLYQRIDGKVDISTWNFEVNGFGSADILLVCSMINMLAILGAGMALIYAVLVNKILSMYFKGCGNFVQKHATMPLIPYAAMGYGLFFIMGQLR